MFPFNNQKLPKANLDRHTFINDRHFEGDADDAHQVRSGNQRAQDGSDTQRLTFTCIDKL